MLHDYFTQDLEASYRVAVLVPDIRKDGILKEYVAPSGIGAEHFLLLDLFKYPGKQKTPAAIQKEYIVDELVPTLHDMGVEVLLVGDADYFKTLTKQSKAEPFLGYALDCEYGPWKVVYTPSFKTVFADPPKVREKISLGLRALTSILDGSYEEPGSNVITSAYYLRDYDSIKAGLESLLEMDCDLTSDIEGFGLKHYDAGIGSISFAWNENEGCAFLVDLTEDQTRVHNQPVRDLLKDFFIRFRKSGRRMIWHNVTYDVYVLIYQLFMSEFRDTEGLFEGLYYLGTGWECTKLITYLATNSCAGNELGLKAQTQGYLGNYAEENIKDITKIPWDKLLLYNLRDTVGTWHTYNKRWPTLVADQQEELYQGLFKSSAMDIIQMQLTGMPVNMERVHEVKAILEADEKAALDGLLGSDLVKEFVYNAAQEWVVKKNQTLKKKRVTLVDVGDKADFNPNSSPQLTKLLYKQIGLPVIETTTTGQPSADGDTLNALVHHTRDPKVLALLQYLIDYKAVNKLVTSFIPALLQAPMAADGWHYLYGSFNLGGTVSGRLSSSNPNMQNLPAAGGDPNDKKTIYGKLIKSCFQAPPGWLFCGLDFDSLEDRISALTTKDPNKLKVYTDGYDGHCLRAFYYFPDRLPGIVDTLESINSIKDLFPDVRKDSKAPTFALTYQGTWSTLVRNCGFSETVAKSIEANYHKMYTVSDKWVMHHLEEATKTGFITAAFGLRIRTPKLRQVFLNTRKTPTSASAEGRTAGNALGQSWCLLNNRAASEFMEEVRSGIYWADILPCSQIHDAQYYLIRQNPEIVAYANEHIVKAVSWQDHPLIQHDEVKLGGQLGIFFPDWTNEITLPKDATSGEAVTQAVDKALAKKKK